MKCLRVKAGIAVVVEEVADAVVETAAAIAEEGVTTVEVHHATNVEVHLASTEVLVVVEIVPEAENDVADLLAGNLRFS